MAREIRWGTRWPLAVLWRLVFAIDREYGYPRKPHGETTLSMYGLVG